MTAKRRCSIKDFRRSRSEQVSLRWFAIKGAMSVRSFSNSGIWKVRDPHDVTKIPPGVSVRASVFPLVRCRSLYHIIFSVPVVRTVPRWVSLSGIMVLHGELTPANTPGFAPPRVRVGWCWTVGGLLCFGFAPTTGLQVVSCIVAAFVGSWVQAKGALFVARMFAAFACP